MTNDQHPVGWIKKPLVEVADFYRGVSWRKSEANSKGKGTPVISIPNIKDGYIDWNCKHFIEKEIKSEQFLRFNDVLFVGSSGSLKNVGRNAQIRKLHQESTFASFTFLGRPNKRIDPHFFYYLVNSPCVDFEKYASRAADGKYNFHLTLFQERTFVMVPSLDEQKKITHILKSIESAIENQNKIVLKTQELKEAVLHKIFSEGLRETKQKQTELGLIPATWSVYPLNELKEFLQYGTSTKCDYHGKGNPVVRIPNIVNGEIKYDDLKWCQLSEREINSLRLEAGDVLFVRTNGVRERVGLCAVYQGQPQEALFASYLIRARLKKDKILPEFFYYFSCTSTGVSQLSGRSSSASDGKFNINTKILDSVYVPIPSSLSEQQEIVNILQGVDQKIYLHERKSRALQAIFATLLNYLMTGQIRVKDLDLKLEEIKAHD